VLNGRTYSRTVDNDYLVINGSSTENNGAFLRLHGKNYDDTPYAGTVLIRAKDNSNVFDLLLKPDGTATWGNKNLAMQEDVVPRSGGYTLRGEYLGRTDNNRNFDICGGNLVSSSATLSLHGGERSQNPGNFYLHARTANADKVIVGYPNGTLTWNGQAMQTTSDQRLKQQITEIDDKLLDAWKDVELSQFKYNDAVNQKGTKARLHTGYVVQQIDEACKSHNVDISDYGLYCHEDYPEETEEVEVTQDDGTTKKETRVIRESSEHYSLRYTEVYAVECAYLRREVSRLKQQNENFEQRLKMLEQSVK